MNVSSVNRRFASKLAAQLDLLEQARQRIIAATARLLQPTGVLVPVKVTTDRQKRANARD
jgi:hypothetical protein